MHRVLLVALLAASSTAFAQSGGSYRVTGGSKAAEGAWPDATGIVFRGTIGCTGTLVAPDVVLTAAHCIDNSLNAVLIGSTDYRSDEGEIIDVDSWAVHPVADIAALKLSEPSTITPRAIGMGCVVDDYLFDDAPVAVVGYGALDAWGNQYDTELVEGFTVVTDHDCSATSRGCQRAVSPGGEIGAGEEGVDACYGDSGGPLYLLTDVGDFLVGVTSRAFNDVRVPCGEGGIWVRPDAFVDWIEDEMGVDIQEPTCTMIPSVSDADLTVPQGRSRNTTLKVEDDDSDAFTYTVEQAPEHGTVSIDDDGKVTYTADDDYLGLDTVVVRVTDTSGYPLGHDLAVIEVEVTERRFLGCNAPLAPVSALWLVGLGGLLVRRRQNLSA